MAPNQSEHRSEPRQPSGAHFPRRVFLKGAAGVGVGVVAAPLLFDRPAFASVSLGTGTDPEQVHLQWGADPTTEVVVSWAAPAAEPAPQVLFGPTAALGTTVDATPQTYVDGISGLEVFTYHAALTGLAPGTTYSYQVSDGGSPANTTPVTTFTTAPSGRSAFTFTSFGDLGTPGAPFSMETYKESQYNAYYAVSQVETLAPLFHLLNGDLCYADKSPTTQPMPYVWRDFGLNIQRSAANRPWMPCIGNHEMELGTTQYSSTGYTDNDNGLTPAQISPTNPAGASVYSGGSYAQFSNGEYGHAAYLTRFSLPDNGTGQFGGSFYSFQVGSVLFISLDASDVTYQDSGAFTATAITTAGGTVIPANTGVYNRQYTGALGSPASDNTVPAGDNVQTQWLETTLAAAAADTSVDWIVVQMHQTALSSSDDNGSDLGIRQAWLPLFDQYQVDLVLCGHDHDYERSFPVRGFNHGQGTGMAGTPRAGQTVDTLQPAPVVDNPALTTFDTTQGTVHLVLGTGGTNTQDNTYGANKVAGTASVNTFTNPKAVAASNKGTGDTSEPAVWSARTDPTTPTNNPYGVAAFTVDPGSGPGATTTLTLTYYHAPAVSPPATYPAPVSYVPPAYTIYETITFTRPRSDGATSPRSTPGVETPEFPTPLLGLAAAAVGAGAVYLSSRNRSGGVLHPATTPDN
ncbi:MAG: purple acid phosphatase family protein [Acidimicrobiales bacterium]|jgi:alkaline phosphatase D